MFKNLLMILIGLLSLTVSQAFAFNCPLVNEIKTYSYTSTGHLPDAPKDWWGFEAKNSTKQTAGIIVKAVDLNTANIQKNKALNHLHAPTKKTIAGVSMCIYEGKLDPKSPQTSQLPFVGVNLQPNQSILDK